MTAAVVAFALGLPAAVAGSWVGVGSTGAYFTDSVAGSLTADAGCEDTHDHGDGPDNGNGHTKCHGNGHTKDRGDQETEPVVVDVHE